MDPSILAIVCINILSNTLDLLKDWKLYNNFIFLLISQTDHQYFLNLKLTLTFDYASAI